MPRALNQCVDFVVNVVVLHTSMTKLLPPGPPPPPQHQGYKSPPKLRGVQNHSNAYAKDTNARIERRREDASVNAVNGP